MEELKGYVSAIRYRNDDNGYTVFDLVSEEEEHTAVGYFSVIETGICLRLVGQYTHHTSYGLQFSVESYEEEEPADVLEMERYLGSGAIKGIGVALAARIVNRFKEDTFRIIEEEPERLAEVSGISENKAMQISDQMQEKKELRQAVMYLQKYNINMNLGLKIYHHFGMEMYKVINENPYRLADEIEGIGFRTADEIARKAGIHIDSDFRIRSGILYTLQQRAGQGHTYLPWEQLLRDASGILEVDTDIIEVQIMNLVMEKKLIVKEIEKDGVLLRQVYASGYFYTERNCAAMLLALNDKYAVAEGKVENFFTCFEREQGIELDEMQKQAIYMAAGNGLLVLTGGPGTGKTMTINAMIQYFESEGMDLYLAAPTGRAAKRMSEMTGYEAKTIHRMLELGGEDYSGFQKNEDNPLETDVIIIDEMSMVDIHLMHALLKAIMPGTRLILVGDAHQLPSVGPGTVLQDILEGGACPVIELKKIFRQAGESQIVVNAHAICNGEPVLLDNKNNDFFFLKRYDANKVINTILELVLNKLPSYVGASSFDIQVLTPTRIGLLGVENLNQVLQQYLNPAAKDKEEKKVGQTIFRQGDKVMQIKNNYKLEWEVTNRYGVTIDQGLGVFNGDVGIIGKVDDYMEFVEVIFDEGRKVIYPFKQLEELELAYAVTVHKSQGSEYPAVVIPLLQGPKPLMNRNLLYTAVTRAKKCVTIVGNQEVLWEMIENGTPVKRFSGLKDRIKEVKAEGCC